MKWVFAYNPASESATVSAPTSEQSPDALAENAVLRGGASLGRSWKATAGATTKSCNFTLGGAVVVDYVAVIGANYSDSAEPKFYFRHQSAPGRTLVATLAKSDPANVWIAAVTGGKSGTNWSYTVDDASADADGIETPLIVFGVRSEIELGALGRPTRAPVAIDPSTIVRGQLGAAFACEQVRQFRQAFAITGSEADAGLATLRALWAWAGKSRPVLSCLDLDDPTAWGATNFGLLEADLAFATEPGMISSGNISILEVVG